MGLVADLYLRRIVFQLMLSIHKLWPDKSDIISPFYCMTTLALWQGSARWAVPAFWVIQTESCCAATLFTILLNQQSTSFEIGLFCAPQTSLNTASPLMLDNGFVAVSVLWNWGRMLCRVRPSKVGQWEQRSWRAAVNCHWQWDEVNQTDSSHLWQVATLVAEVNMLQLNKVVMYSYLYIMM